MIIKELHKDIERYLQEDCYCPNEIYGTDGFGYRLHYVQDKCNKFLETEGFVSCITEYANEVKMKPMILIFFKESNKIVDALEYDATENNINGLKHYVTTGEKFIEDHFSKDWNKGLKEMLSLCDAIIAD